MINNDDIIMFGKLNIEYFNLAKEFRNFVLRYDINHEHISDSVLNDIVKRPIEYILRRRQSNYDTDSDESESEDEKNHLIILLNNKLMIYQRKNQLIIV